MALSKWDEKEIILNILKDFENGLDFISLIRLFNNEVERKNEICIEEPLPTLMDIMLCEEKIKYENGVYKINA